MPVRALLTPAERSDLELLLLCAATVPLLWLLAMGWDPSLSAGAHDQVASTLPIVHDLFGSAGGDWTRQCYRLELLGGATVADVIGTMPLVQVLGWLGASTVAALNLLLFFTQVVCGFFGARVASDLAGQWSPASPAPGRASTLGIIVLCAFSPEVAWRITAGHPATLLGAMVWIGLFSLLLALRAGTATVTLVAVWVLTLLQALPSSGAEQQLVYGPVFAGLLVLAAARDVPARKLVVPVLAGAGALALSLPKLAGMVHHALGSDAGRALGRESVVFSYVTGTLRDWVASVPWGKELLASHREPQLWHEVNYGFGPPLLLLAAAPWRRSRLLGAGLMAGLLLAILFSVDAPGVATALTTLVPPVRSFRVPERAVIPFALALPAFASAAVLLRLEGRRSGALPSAVGIGTGALLFVAPQAVREAAAWCGALVVVLGAVGYPRWLPRLPAPAILLGLGLASAAAFKERLLPFPAASSVVEAPAALGRQIREREPDLASPLSRVVMGFDLPELQVNSAYMMGLSSLSGYLNPPRRFLALEAALAGLAENPLVNYFAFREESASTPVLRQLYNVRYALRATGDKVDLAALGPTAGRAWFSSRIVPVPAMADLAAALRVPGDDLARVAHSTLWTVASDPAVQSAGLAGAAGAGCERSEVLAALAEHGGQSVTLKVRNDALCPLTVAMSFTTNLRARAAATPMALFPAYGALTGVLVPPGITELTIEAVPYLPAWTIAGPFVGLALLAAALAALRGRRRASEPHGIAAP